MSSNSDDTTPLNLLLPKELSTFVEQMTHERGIAPDEYVLGLIREERRRAGQELLRKLLVEGLESGTPIEVTPEYWERKDREFEERHRSRGSG